MIIKIEQRLEDPARILVLPVDEAIVLGVPFMMGLMSRTTIVGIVVALILWWAWRKLKGTGGIDRLLAATYWYLPASLGVYNALPDSAHTNWEG